MNTQSFLKIENHVPETGGYYFSHQTDEIMQKIKALHTLKTEGYSSFNEEYQRREFSDFSFDSTKADYKKNIDEILFDACANVKIATSQVSMYLDEVTKNKLFKQIDILHSVEEWDTEDKPINLKSYKSFLKWVLLANPSKTPGLGLSHGGNVIAVWMNKQDRLILEFHPNEKVTWITKMLIGEDVESAHGNSTILRLPEILNPYAAHFFLGGR